MERSSRIYVAGHQGLVGSALVRRLKIEGYTNVLTTTRRELELTDSGAVFEFFERARPEYIFLAAARVGGIHANQRYGAEFIYNNLVIQTSVIHAAYRCGVRRLLFFGCGCAYPKDAPQPLREEYLLSGPLEPTSEPYATAKIAGIAMCDSYRDQYGVDFFSVIPASVYGPNDNVDPENSHVLSALMRKCEATKMHGGPVVVWGSGTPKREFLYADDLAEACIFLMRLDSSTLQGALGPRRVLNVGVGEDISVADLAEMVRDIVRVDGPVAFDRTKPDGTPQKLLDSGRLRRLGWKPGISLEEGIRRTYEWFKGHA